MAFRDLTQEHLQQFHGRAAAIAPAFPFDARQGLGVAGEPAFNSRQNVRTRARALHAARERAQLAQQIGRAGGRQRDLDHDVVLEDPRARHIAGLGLEFAPGGDLHQHREIAGLAGAVAQALPGVVGVLLIGGHRGERLHLVGEPAGAVGLLEPRAQGAVDVAQMSHIRQRIGDLRLREGTARPVGEAGGLVHGDLADGLHQLPIADLIAKAADHGGNLRIEQGGGNHLGEIPHDFNILARCVEDLHDGLVGHQLIDRAHVEPLGQGVHRHRLVIGGELDDAELRPKGRLPQELGVHGDKGVPGEAAANRSEVFGRRDQAHRSCLYMNRPGCTRLVGPQRDYSPVYPDYGRIRAMADREKHS